MSWAKPAPWRMRSPPFSPPGPTWSLLDVHLPDGGGRAIIESVVREWPEAVFLALSVSDAADDVVAVIRAGARGYVTKTIDRR